MSIQVAIIMGSKSDWDVMSHAAAMLSELDANPEIYTDLEQKTEYLHKGLSKVLNKHNVEHTINRIGSMISVHFAKDSVIDFDTAAKGNNQTFKDFFHGMLDQGIYIAPSAFESWFLNNALSYKDLDETISACDHHFSKK